MFIHGAIPINHYLCNFKDFTYIRNHSLKVFMSKPLTMMYFEEEQWSLAFNVMS